MTKPSLHEIAAMPYPASEKAMREHYDPHWGKYEKGEKAKFSVKIEYSYKGADFQEFEVEAKDEAEAQRMALDLFDAANLDLEYGCEFDDFGNITVSRA